MALSIKFLKSLGIDEDKIEAIAEAHGATVNGLKDEIAKFKAEAEKVTELQAQLDKLQSEKSTSEDWEQKYQSEHKALEDLKNQVAGEKVKEQKTRLYRAMLEKIGVNSAQLDAIIKVTDIDKIEVDEKGELKDSEALAESAKKEWGGFIVKERIEGSNPATPPKAQTMVEGADPEIQKRVLSRHERLYGASEQGKEG